MAVEVVDGHGQIVIRVDQPGVGRDDTVPVGVGVVAGGDVVQVPVGDQGGHRVGRAAIHPDLAVGVQCHEPKCRIHQRINHGQIQIVPLGDHTPVVHTGPAQRVGTDPHPGIADRTDVDHVWQVVDISVEVVMAPCRAQRARQRHPFYVSQATAQNLVGALGDCISRIAVGRTTARRVVLEPAVGRRIVRRCHDDAVGQAAGAVTVVVEDGVADRRCRRVAVGGVDHGDHVVGGEHLQSRHPRRLGKGMRVAAEEQRPGRALRGAVLDDGLGNGQDVGLVECPVQR
ncbi:hypothetical protein MYXE_34910 [Mycobacterium xenopi]|uniref:Uncharacterized protein n=1 Tax=Mycobacterium xenopi TaxID=1789 RepID=A0AAD1H2M6_MYCXE|nr:hypothetical protein MYXE_34910 [Mycobacterium xenopi]